MNKKIENEIIDATINADIAELSSQFLEDLKVDIKELEDYFVSITKNIHVNEISLLAKDITHRLIGSSGLFGFNDLVECFTKLDNLFELLISSSRNKNIIKLKINSQLQKLKQIHVEKLNKNDNLNIVPFSSVKNYYNDLRILLIEDDIASGELLARILSHYCRYFNWSTNLSNGIQLLNSQIYDLVLLDLNLSDSKGLKTLKTIQNLAPEIPIIVLTAKNDLNLSLKALSCGASEYLNKTDFKSRDMLNLILQVLEKHDQLENTAKMAIVKDFIAILQHDLNSPIASSANCLELIIPKIKDQISSEELNYLEIIKTSLIDVKESINNLLTIYRLQENQQNLPKEFISLKKIIKTIINNHDSKIKAKNLKVQINVPDSKLNILCNKELFSLLFNNIIFNTINYSYRNSTITIEVKNFPNNILNILINNKGDSIQGKENSLNRPWLGVPGEKYVAKSGLGLYFANLIAKKHDGIIRCLGSDNSINSFVILWSNELV